MDKSKIFPIKFNGNNYFGWEFQFQLYVIGKELWRHIDGLTKKPTNKTKLAKQDKEEAQIICWIMNL